MLIRKNDRETLVLGRLRSMPSEPTKVRNTGFHKLLKATNRLSTQEIGPGFLDQKLFLSDEVKPPDTLRPSEKRQAGGAKPNTPETKDALTKKC